MENWLVTDGLLVSLFAFQHTIGTRDFVKDFVNFFTGGRKFLWNLIYSIVTLLIMYIMYAYWERSDVLIWKANGIWVYVIIGLNVLSNLMFLYMFKYTSFGAWLGVKQFYRMITGKKQDDVFYSFKKTGFKRYIRFPHHTFLIPIFWLLPTMTLDLVFLAVCGTVYTWVGTIHQDHRGRSYLGKDWIEYSKVTRIILPAPEHVIVDVINFFRKKAGKDEKPKFH